MELEKKTFTILIAEDDRDDRQIIQEALEENKLISDIYFVADGEELINYLFRRGKYSDPETFPKYDLILLDLNMPKKDGREALREIKSNPDFKGIPIVILTTSDSKDDIRSSYNIGANSFITKPASYSGFIDTVKTIVNYWFETARLPGNNN